MISWWWLGPAWFVGIVMGIMIAPLADDQPRGEIHIPPGQKL